MSALGLEIVHCGTIVTVQDAPRAGGRAMGLAGAGPMDRAGYARAGAQLRPAAGSGLEVAAGRVSLRVVGEGELAMGWAGGRFGLRLNGQEMAWPGAAQVRAGAQIEVTPGPAGNWGYLRFGREIDVPVVLGSRSTHLAVALGGLDGRSLVAGDRLSFVPSPPAAICQTEQDGSPDRGQGPLVLPVIWGVHAQAFARAVRAQFVAEPFTISSRMDRMGVHLVDKAGVFTGGVDLSLVSEASVPGDIQILGDGTPIVLMREGQTTGGYPRIATLPEAEIDRFAQARPGTQVRFAPVSLARYARTGPAKADAL